MSDKEQSGEKSVHESDPANTVEQEIEGSLESSSSSDKPTDSDDIETDKVTEETPKGSPTTDNQSEKSIRVESTVDLESELTHSKEQAVDTSDVGTGDAIMDVEEISKSSTTSDKQDKDSPLIVDAVEDTKESTLTDEGHIVDRSIVEKDDTVSAEKVIEETSESLPASGEKENSSIRPIEIIADNTKIEATSSKEEQTMDKADIEMDEGDAPECTPISNKEDSCLIVDTDDTKKTSEMTDTEDIVEETLVEKDDADSAKKVIEEISESLPASEEQDKISLVAKMAVYKIIESSLSAEEQAVDDAAMEIDDAMEVEVPQCSTSVKKDMNINLMVDESDDTKKASVTTDKDVPDKTVFEKETVADPEEVIYEASEDILTSDEKYNSKLPVTITLKNTTNEQICSKKDQDVEKCDIEVDNAMEVESVEEISKCTLTSDKLDINISLVVDLANTKDSKDSKEFKLENISTSEYSSYSLSSEDALKSKQDSDSDKSRQADKTKEESQKTKQRKPSTQESTTSASPISLTGSSEFSLSGSDSKSESLNTEKESERAEEPPQKSTYKIPSKSQIRKTEMTGRKKVLTQRKALLKQHSDSDSSSDLQVEEAKSCLAAENKEIANKDTFAVSKYTDSSTLTTCSSRFARKLNWPTLSETTARPPEKRVTFQNPCISEIPEDTRVSDGSDNSFVDTQLGFKSEKEINLQEHADTILSDSSANSLSNVDLRLRPSYHPRDVRQFDGYVKHPKESSVPEIIKSGVEVCKSGFEVCGKSIITSMRRFTAALDKLGNRKKALESQEPCLEKIPPIEGEPAEAKPAEAEAKPAEAEPAEAEPAEAEPAEAEPAEAEPAEAEPAEAEPAECEPAENIEESLETQSVMSPEFSRMSMSDESEISNKLIDSSDKTSAEGRTFIRPQLTKTTSGSFADVSEQESDSSDQYKKQKKPFCKRKTFQTPSEEEDTPSKRRQSLQRQASIDEDVEMKVIPESEIESESVVSHSVSMELTLAGEKLRQSTTSSTNITFGESRQKEMTPEESNRRWKKFCADSYVKPEDSDDTSEEISSGKDDNSSEAPDQN